MRSEIQLGCTRYIASLGRSQAKADKPGFIRSARVAPYRSEYLHGALESGQGLGPKRAFIGLPFQ